MITILLAGGGAYIGATRAQAQHEIRIGTLENRTTDVEHELIEADRQYDARVRADMAELKADIKEMRAAQQRILERLATPCSAK